MMLKSGALKKVEDFLKGFPVPEMTTSKVNELSSFPTESLRSPTLHCIEGAFMFSKRCRIVVEVLKHCEHKVVVLQDKDPFFSFKRYWRA